MPTAATAARSWSAKRSSSRSTSRPSGPWNGSGARQSPSAPKALGITFQGGEDAYLQAGLAGALGTVEVRPLDLTSAFGTFANGGVHVPPRMILEVRGPDGSLVWKAPKPEGEKAVSGQTAFLMNDILAGNSDPKINAAWGPVLETRGPGGNRRPVAAKTGTAQDARDLSTYGYLAPPKDKDKPGLVVGIWMGNSDHSLPRSRDPATSIKAAAPLWHAFVEEYSKKWPIAKFQRPSRVVTATIDAWSGGKPGPWTRETRKEFFVRGTQPTARNAVDEAGLLYSVLVAAGVSTPSRRSSVRQPGTATSRSGCAALVVGLGSSAGGTRRRRTSRARVVGRSARRAVPAPEAGRSRTSPTSRTSRTSPTSPTSRASRRPRLRGGERATGRRRPCP